MDQPDLKTLIGLLAAAFALALRATAWRLLQALISPKVVEWAVLKLLHWLSRQTKSQVDDELVQKVAEAMQGSEASGLSRENQPEPAQAVPACPACPACGQPLP
ncbi:MAG: hypothetical protein IPM52_14480 [Bacteroidetes bacterium]|nr:hypothetical protein [Bacteroidota bacterium]